MSKELNKILQAYELKPNCHYLIEVKEWGVTMQQLSEAWREFAHKDIWLTFIPTAGQGFALQAVPAQENDTELNDLELDKPLDNTDTANPPQSDLTKGSSKT